MKEMDPSYSTRRVPRSFKGSSIAFALLSSIAFLTAALDASGAAARAAEVDVEPTCSFSEKTIVGCSEPSGPECNGEERLPAGVGVLECREKCCKDPWCGGWRHHAYHGCWHSYDGSLDAECWATNSSRNCRADGWRGETRRSGFGTKSEGGEGSTTKQSCCPGRWCCPSGNGCCPPWEVHLGAIDDGPSAAHDESAVRGAALLGEHDLDFLVDEGVNGLLWVCEQGESGTYLGVPLRLTGDGSEVCPPPLLWHRLWCALRSRVETRMPRNSSNTPSHCSASFTRTTVFKLFSPGCRPPLPPFSGCHFSWCFNITLKMRCDASPQEFARAGVAEAIAKVLRDERGDVEAGRRGSLAYVRGSDGCQNRNAAIQRADRLWRLTDGIPDGQCRPQVPTLAFRWLAGSENDIRTTWGAPLQTRHRRGEVIVSDKLRAIYVNVPKTGSTSVKTALALVGDERTDLWHNLNGATRSTYLVFAFARDPMARFVSAYNEVEDLCAIFLQHFCHECVARLPRAESSRAP